MGAIKEIKHWSLDSECCNVSNTSNEIASDIYVPKDWLLNYSELKLKTLRASYGDGRTCQGGCTDGEYIYRALIDTNTSLTTLQKVDRYTGDILMSVTDTSYTHANDMCYCSKDGYLYIAHGSENNTQISKVNRVTLKEVDQFTIPTGIWSIAYNAEDDLFIVGASGSYYFVVYTFDWSMVYRLRPKAEPVGYVKQSITCDSNYIYAGYYRGDKKGCLINVFTWNGMSVKNFIIDTDKELEFVDKIDNFFYIGFYDGRDIKELRYNSISKAEFDLYNGATSITLRPTDNEGGISKLSRLPDGTEVCVFRGSATNGTIKCLNKVNSDAFRFYKVVGVGHNQFTTNWFKGGRCKLTEFNTDDTAGSMNIDFKEAILGYDKVSNTFTFESNVNHKMYISSEGFITHAKGDTNSNESNLTLIEITQIWGIV